MNFELEKKLEEAVRQRGGYCIPFNNIGMARIIRCLIILPGIRDGKIIQLIGFIGLKPNTYELSRDEMTEWSELSGTGVLCYMVDIEETIALVLDDIQLGINPGTRFDKNPHPVGINPRDNSIRNILIPVVGIDKSYYYTAHPELSINDATAIFVTDDGVEIKLNGEYPKLEKLMKQIRVF